MSFLASSSLCQAEGRKPNVLVIVADDLGYGDPAIQGGKDIPTPNIDAIARNGIRFTSGYVSAPICSPSRAGLMTGRYQQRFGHEFNPGPLGTLAGEGGLPVGEKTMGDCFKAANYTTGWFGKSHLGMLPEFHPQKRGFDEFYGFLDGAHNYLKVADKDGVNAVMRGTQPVEKIGYTTESFAEETVSFIARHKDQPWLVYLPFNAVHGPLQATPKYLARFPQLTDNKRRTFAAQLSALDDAVGSVVGKIRELHLEEDTLIFFISDNGGAPGESTSSNAPLRGAKGSLWEGGIRVPMMVQWKSHLPAGKVDDRPVISLDILPTALAAAGEKPDPQHPMDGVNLLPYLTGEKPGDPHELLYWRFGNLGVVRKGSWKMIRVLPEGIGPKTIGEKAALEGGALYDLDKDISEKTNLSAREPEKLKELNAAWETWNAQLMPAQWPPLGQGGEEPAGTPAAEH
ncbi:MAG: sulfatase-like hydrolase/transferase [Luteolibacter sp.]